MVNLEKNFYTNTEMREIAQELIDICFQCVLVATDDKCYKIKNAKNDEIKAEWVARQLRSCGFNTEPMGMSWGVLQREDS